MDFVGDDEGVVFGAEVCKGGEGLAWPDGSAWVVGVGQDEGFGAEGEHLFELVEVHLVAVGGWFEGVVDDGSSVVLGYCLEWGVYGWLDDDVVSGFCECVYGKADAFDDSWDVGDPFGLDIPVMEFFLPLDDGGSVSRGFLCVSEYGVFDSFFEGLDDEWGCCEVHVGYPEGYEVGVAVACFEGVGFEGVCSSPVYDFVEVVGLLGGAGVEMGGFVCHVCVCVCVLLADVGHEF